MFHSYSLFAYIGPDQMLPVASAFAAAMGVVLMFWRFFLNMVTRPFRFVFRRDGGSSSSVGAAAAAMNEPVVTAADKHENA